MISDYLSSSKKLFLYYKSLGEKAIDQLEENQLYDRANEDSNSIAIIIKHLAGNMLSRWTDVLTTDGEKPWRNRDQEFENEAFSKADLMHLWEQGWSCLLGALDACTEQDLGKIIYIRNEGHTLLEGINRQLAHYPYHVGQIVYIAKELKKGTWNTLSIARNQSNQFNEEKFSQEKRRKHFTDGTLEQSNPDASEPNNQ